MVAIVPDYHGIAEKIVKRDGEYGLLCNPVPQHIFIKWRGDVYKGAIQKFFSDRSDIGFMTKSKEPYEQELVDEILAIDQRIFMETDTDFDIRGIAYVVGVHEDKISRPTGEQIQYFKKNGPEIHMLDITL